MTAHSASAAVPSGHRFDEKRCWMARLTLAFEPREEGHSRPVTRLVKRHHEGPLRVQRPFYPEGPDGCCHVYLLHPPGGLVSGDQLHVRATVGGHVLLTTPSAAKLYKSDSHGVPWCQTTHLTVQNDAVLEYLPQETIAFSGAHGRQHTHVDLSGTARTLGWEVLALGRPASNEPFGSGWLEQRFHIHRDGQPIWIERQILNPKHRRFQGAWGQGGGTVQATLWAVGLANEEDAIGHLRAALPDHARWAVTSRRGVLLMRYIGQEKNEAWSLCQQAWHILRPYLNGQAAHVPRIWNT